MTVSSTQVSEDKNLPEPRQWAPLSHFQREFYDAYRLTPEKLTSMHMLFPMRIRSQVDVPALQRAFQQLINRHAILRTTFPTHNGQPVQMINDEQEIGFTATDVWAWTQDELDQTLYEAAQRLFDLEQGPMFRVHLFTRGADDVVLLLVIHHIILDMHSLWILLEELYELYRAQRHGDTPQLPPVTITFAEYADWQRTMLQSAQGARLAAYWAQTLGGELPILKLPTDYPRPLVRTTKGATHFFRIEAALTQQLQTLVQAESVTLYMVLLTVYQLLLYHRSGQTEFLLGTLTANRVPLRFDQVVGPLADVLPLRVSLAELAHRPGDAQPTLTFKTLLHQVSTQTFHTLMRQNYPWLLLSELLQKQPLPYNTPVIPATFNLVPSSKVFPNMVELFAPGSTQPIPFGELMLEPYRVLPLWLGAWVPCCVEMMEGANSLLGFITYITALYKADTIVQFAKDFEYLLTAIVTRPNQPVATLLHSLQTPISASNGDAL